MVFAVYACGGIFRFGANAVWDKKNPYRLFHFAGIRRG
jgi:hypothetical protein